MACDMAIGVNEAPKSRLQPCDSVRNANSAILASCHVFTFRVCSVEKNDFVLFIKFSRFNNSATFHLLGLRTLARVGVGS